MPTTEVIVTLKAPALTAFGRSLTSARHAPTPASSRRRRRQAERNLLARDPRALRIRWRYRLVANGFAVVLPSAEVAALAHVPGVAKVWPNVDLLGVAVSRISQHRPSTRAGGDRRRQALGPGLATAGNGMKIGIIDDGLDASHPFFNAAGFAYPPGFPKGRTDLTTPKVIVQRTFAPPSPALEVRGDARSTRAATARSTPPTSPASPPATTARRTGPSSSRASRRARTSATTRR